MKLYAVLTCKSELIIRVTMASNVAPSDMRPCPPSPCSSTNEYINQINAKNGSDNTQESTSADASISEKSSFSSPGSDDEGVLLHNFRLRRRLNSQPPNYNENTNSIASSALSPAESPSYNDNAHSPRSNNSGSAYKSSSDDETSDEEEALEDAILNLPSRIDRIQRRNIQRAIQRCDFSSQESILKYFPTYNGRGKLRPPTELINNYQTAKGKAIFVLEWRCKTKSQQEEVKAGMQSEKQKQTEREKKRRQRSIRAAKKDKAEEIAARKEAAKAEREQKKKEKAEVSARNKRLRDIKTNEERKRRRAEEKENESRVS